jgi:uncharacterized damage-inducible protein DinB
MARDLLSAVRELKRSLEEQRANNLRCLELLSEEQVWQRPLTGLNSIGNLLLHLTGNERHYVGLGVGGVEYRRDRPREFTTQGGVSKAQLRELQLEAQRITAKVIDGLSEADLAQPAQGGVDYDGRDRLGLLLHVFHHYSYHSGQILLWTKILTHTETQLLRWKH